MKRLLSLIFFYTLSAQPMEIKRIIEPTKKSILITLKENKKVTINEEHHQMLCSLSEAYKKEVLAHGDQLSLNISLFGFLFIHNHLDDLNALVNNVGEQDIAAFNRLEKWYNNSLSREEKKIVRDTVKELGLPSRLQAGVHYLPREIKKEISKYLFNDLTKWPLLKDINNYLLEKTYTYSYDAPPTADIIDTSKEIKTDKITIKVINESDISVLFAENNKKIVLKGHTEKINCLCIADKGNKLVSLSKDALQIWDINTGICLKTLDDKGMHCSDFKTVQVLDNKLIYIANDQTIKILNLENGCEQIDTLYGHTSDINSISIAKDNILSATNSEIKIWNMYTAVWIKTFDFGSTCPPIVQGNMLITCNRCIYINDLDTGQLLASMHIERKFDEEHELTENDYLDIPELKNIPEHSDLFYYLNINEKNELTAYSKIHPNNRDAEIHSPFSWHGNPIRSVWNLNIVSNTYNNFCNLPLKDIAIVKIIQDERDRLCASFDLYRLFGDKERRLPLEKAVKLGASKHLIKALEETQLFGKASNNSFISSCVVQ